MADAARRLLSRLAVSNTRMSELLAVVPKWFRAGETLAVFRHLPDGNAAQMDLVKRLWDTLAGTADDQTRLARVFAIMDVLDGIGIRSHAARDLAIQRLSRWGVAEIDAFADLRRFAGTAISDPVEAKRWAQWLLQAELEGAAGVRLDIAQLRRNHPDFAPGTRDPSRVRDMPARWRSFCEWDHGAHPIRDPMPPHAVHPISGTARWGRALEEESRATFAAHGRNVSNLDAQNTRRTVGAPPHQWVFPGRDYGALPADASNFREVDSVVRTATGLVVFTQITHGTPRSLKDKFKKLFHLASSTTTDLQRRREAIEDLQKLGLLSRPTTGTGLQRIQAAVADYLSRARLLVPPDSVDGLRMLIASDPSITIWAQRLGISRAALLDRILPTPRVYT